MDKDQKEIFNTGNAPAKDWFLQFLVNLANKKQFELDITLTTGGFQISGTLTGVRQYFDKFGAYFASPFGDKGNVEEVSATFQEIGDQCSCVSPSEQTENPSYIHLKNARFYGAGGRSFTGESPTWWRGRLSEIQGFAPGLIEPGSSRDVP